MRRRRHGLWPQDRRRFSFLAFDVVLMAAALIFNFMPAPPPGIAAGARRDGALYSRTAIGGSTNSAAASARW